MDDVVFSPGEQVFWESQANGFRKVKEGIIIQVISPGAIPDLATFRNKYLVSQVERQIFQNVKTRKITSYLVLVGREVFWPRSDYLKCK